MPSAEAVAVMACQICKTGLTMSDRSGVEIDYCQTCRGVWLDRSELDKIIERSAQDAAPARSDAEPPRSGYRPGGYRDNDDDHRHRHGTRMKPFLTECSIDDNRR